MTESKVPRDTKASVVEGNAKQRHMPASIEDFDSTVRIEETLINGILVLEIIDDEKAPPYGWFDRD